MWGGTNTLAQALHKLKATRTETELKALVAKLRVHTISDQDDAGIWIRTNFPELFYIVSPGGYGAATWTGISQVVEGIDNTSISNRWIATHIQHDFAARMDWTINSYADANHPPQAKLTHDEVLRVKAGQYFSLDASASTDPDGDSLSFYWFAYPEVTGDVGALKINAENLARISLQAPAVKEEKTLHFIARVTDKGEPALSRYARVRVVVTPN